MKTGQAMHMTTDTITGMIIKQLRDINQTRDTEPMPHGSMDLHLHRITEEVTPVPEQWTMIVHITPVIMWILDKVIDSTDTRTM